MNGLRATRWAAPAIDPHGRGALILNLRTGTWVHLNPTATAYWQSTVEERHAHHHTVTALAAHFDVTEKELARDLDELIQDLRAQRLVEVIT
ncbi:PqqD family protein [Nocardiopsis sp. NPDC049922]|uniref:PqqD family protein n=1 Tax=Nocardiopsis sp. NPDC049922 TaxID=3155157 RepID=UPI0033DF66E0